MLTTFKSYRTEQQPLLPSPALHPIFKAPRPHCPRETLGDFPHSEKKMLPRTQQPLYVEYSIQFYLKSWFILNYYWVTLCPQLLSFNPCAEKLVI